MALTDKLTAVADAIRGKTGKTEPLTLDQMAAEIAGIVAGDGGLAYDMGEFVFDTDIVSRSAENGIPHSFGKKPGFILIWTDDYVDLSADNLIDKPSNTGYVWMDGMTGLLQRLTSSLDSDLGILVNFCINSNEYRLSPNAPTSKAYFFGETTIPTDAKFGLPKTGASTYWRAGVVYKYFVSEAWWNIGGVANAE